MASVSATADRGAWLRLLARWGLLTSLTVAGLMTTFFSGMATVSSQPGIGGDHDELLMAAYAPWLYRIAMVFDALGWLFMGGSSLSPALLCGGTHRFADRWQPPWASPRSRASSEPSCAWLW